MAQTLVTVAAYHNATGLRAALDSVLSQSFLHWNCWIVQDGCGLGCTYHDHNSRRTCVECPDCLAVHVVAMEFVRKSARFCFHVLPANFGAHGWGPRNLAILNTDHPILAYLDDDCTWEPDHIKLAVKELETCDFTWSGSYLWRNGVRVAQRLVTDQPRYYGLDTSELVFKRSVIEACGGWRDDRERYCTRGANDWDMVYRAIVAGFKGRNVGKVTVNYTTHEPNWRFRLKQKLMPWVKRDYTEALSE